MSNADLDVSKLPQKWRAYIRELENKVQRLEFENARLADGERYKASDAVTDTIVEPFDHKGAVGLARGAMVQFTPDEDPQVFETTHYHYRHAMRIRNITDSAGIGWVEVSGDAPMTLETHGSNTYRIRVRP